MGLDTQRHTPHNTHWATVDQSLVPISQKSVLFLPHRGSRPHTGHCARMRRGHCGRGTGAGPGLSALSGNL